MKKFLYGVLLIAIVFTGCTNAGAGNTDERAELTQQKTKENERTIVVLDDAKSTELPKEQKETKLEPEDNGPVITTETEILGKLLAYKSTSEYDATLDKGVTKVKQAGENGAKTVTVEITYTDGVETSRETISKEITKEPVTEITVIGTKEYKPVITSDTITTIEAVAFDVDRISDSSLEKGSEVVMTAGVNGACEVKTKITYTDGVETNRSVLSNIVTKEPVNQVVAVGTKEPEPVAQPTIEYEYSAASEVIRLTNIERQNAGLSALSYNSALDAGAYLRAQELEVSFSHSRPDGSIFATAFSNIGYSSMGENVAKGYSTASSVVSGWMNSAGHRANILDSGFTQISVGHVIIDGYCYWAMILMTP